MMKLTLSVLCVRNGSRKALLASGSRSMSDSLIAWNPRIDEPSKPRPSLKVSSPKVDAGMVKCCMTPGRSQKRTSTYSTSLSRMKAATSSGLVNIDPPEVGGLPTGKLRGGSCPGVSQVFRSGNNTPGVSPGGPLLAPRGVLMAGSTLSCMVRDAHQPSQERVRGASLGLPPAGPGSLAAFGTRVI